MIYQPSNNTNATKALRAPLITIVTVTKNNLTGLKKTHESIQEQTLPDFEWLVIDGDSDDGTKEYLKDHKNNTAYKYLIRYSSAKDDGIYDAMNKGIKYAYGKYIIFMNAGDCFATPKAIETLKPHMAKSPDFLYADALETSNITTKPIKKPAMPHTNIQWGMFTHHQAMIYSTKRIKEHNMHYALRFKIASDYDFTARFLKNAKKITYIPKPLCIFEHGGISQQRAYQGRREQFIIKEELELVSSLENVLIFTIQSLTWTLKNKAPFIYSILRALRINKP